MDTIYKDVENEIEKDLEDVKHVTIAWMNEKVSAITQYYLTVFISERKVSQILGLLESHLRGQSALMPK